MGGVRSDDGLADDGGRQREQDAGGAEDFGFAQREAHYRGSEATDQQEQDAELEPVVRLEGRNFGHSQQLTRSAHRNHEEQAGETQADAQDAAGPARTEDALRGG